MDEATLNQLLESAKSSGTATGLPDINAIMASLAPYMIAMTVVSVLVMILYIFSVIGKWRANKAMLDIRKLLIEMNERDKARSGVTALRAVSDAHTTSPDQTPVVTRP
jgi:hypothetical protein